MNVSACTVTLFTDVALYSEANTALQSLLPFHTWHYLSLDVDN